MDTSLTCQSCGHDDTHSPLVGCLHPDPCDCETFVSPTVASTIPARRTDPETSHAATRAIGVKAGTQRARLLLAFHADDRRMAETGGDPGLTDEEAMEDAYGVSAFSEYAKRCSELRDAGLIAPTGKTRKGGTGKPRIVSAITDAGRLAARSL